MFSGGDPYPVEYLMRHQVGKNRNHERDLMITTLIPKYLVVAHLGSSSTPN